MMAFSNIFRIWSVTKWKNVAVETSTLILPLIHHDATGRLIVDLIKLHDMQPGASDQDGVEVD